ncbi:MAG TPA: DUF6677 family protein [Vicinamibacterales bacterium]|nr:DUF6677 family protein [Vicinamibacterales bacterium]
MQPNPALTFIAAWCVPGAGHFLVGQVRKAVVFLVVLAGMFATGLAFGGQLFVFDAADPLVFLGAGTQWAILVPRALAAMAGAGAGHVTAISYEYGNTFLIVAGLLNILVALDAFDRARGSAR